MASSQQFQEFHDPRLVALYDLQDPDRSDTAFFVDLAGELSATSIIDVGCGTGAITCELASLGYRITGVDPSPAMLEVARHRPGADEVRWIEGDASACDGPPVDLAIMTGHVAQVINDEETWRDTLAAIHRAIRPGGQLAFDSRNPAAREWLRWTPDRTRERLADTPFGPVDTWWQVTDLDGELVRTEIHYCFAANGETRISSNVLRFRSQDALERSLAVAGFTVRRVYGDWDRAPVTASSPELIFVAARR